MKNYYLVGCCKCLYEWTLRGTSTHGEFPLCCPKCRSTSWRDTSVIVDKHRECSRCGRNYEYPTPNCPGCGSYKWGLKGAYMNSIVVRKECLRCDHLWRSRVTRPVRCPRCKNFNWDKEGLRYRPANLGPRPKVKTLRRYKYDFAQVEAGGSKTYPWYMTEDGQNLDWQANAKRAIALTSFLRRARGYGNTYRFTCDIRSGLTLHRLS